MSLIKKSDVKNHLSARHHNRIHVVSQPDGTGFSGAIRPEDETNESVVTQDHIGDHATLDAMIAPSGDSSTNPGPPVSANLRPAKP